MKYYFLFLLISVLFFSCNSTKKTTVNNQNISYWKLVDINNIPKKYSLYKVYTLNEENFINALKIGKVSFPNNNGTINTFIVEESQTMSPELAAKFPNIKSYKGEQIDNKLCSSRIDRKENNIKIVVFCNKTTYYISKDKETNFYIVYTKENVPAGIGVVNEK